MTWARALSARAHLAETLQVLSPALNVGETGASGAGLDLAEFDQRMALFAGAELDRVGQCAGIDHQTCIGERSIVMGPACGCCAVVVRFRDMNSAEVNASK